VKFNLAKHEAAKKLLWGKIRAFGKLMRGARNEGYLYCGKFYLIHSWGEWERGENYRPSGCDCGIPPWEVCKHSIY
jgi:hypothetical protein